MNLFTSKDFDSFEALFFDQLQDLYDAETRLTNALPQMEDAATSPELKQAFRKHLGETQNQVTRLEQIFQQLNQSPGRETCEAMKGLIKEGDEMVQAKGDADVKDAALIAAAQRVEHYEIAGYGTACAFARRLGYDDIARSLEQSLEEEKHADAHLNQIAEQSVNLAAQQHA